MKRTGIVTVATLLLSAPFALAQQGFPMSELYQLRATYDRFHSEVSGIFRSGEFGTEIDIDGDLGVTDAKTWAARGALQFRQGLKLRGSYTKIDFDGASELGRDILFRDTVFFSGEEVVTSVKGNYFTGEFEWDFSQGPWGYMGVLLGAKIFDTDMVLLSGGTREVDTLRRAVPSAGLTGRGYFGKVSVSAEVSGFTMGSKGHILEADGHVQLHLSDRLAVHGGYRYLKVKNDENNEFLDVKVKGWVYGLEISL